MKTLYQLEAKLGGYVSGDLAKEAFTPLMSCIFKDSDDPSASNTRIPDPNTKIFELDPKNTQGKMSEYILCESHSTENGVTTLVNVTRGLQRDGTINLTGSADRAQQWSSPPIGVATEPFNLNLLRAYLTGVEAILGNLTLSGNNTFSGTNLFSGITTHTAALIINGTSSYLKLPELTSTQRDALTPVEGMLIKNSTTGFGEIYAGGMWQTLDTGIATVNASLTVSGKVEVATSAQSIAATDIGETGAFLMILPSDLAANIQTNTYIFASSATGNDTYVAIPIPAIPGYVQGQRFLVKVDTANTGPCTLNINSKGAIDIKLQTGEDPQTGDIMANQIIEVIYNSTGPKFVLQTTPGLLTNASNASEKHYHDLIRNNSLSKRIYSRISDAEVGGASSSNGFGIAQVTTAASDNAIAYIRCLTYNLAGSSIISVHSKSPSFRVNGAFNSAAAQDGFIGFVDSTVSGTSLENSVMTLDHFGFIVQDGTLFISCGSGAAQTKIDISATVPSVTAGHTFEAYFDGTTATFYVDNVEVGSPLNTNVPNSNLMGFYGFVIADATAAAKTLRLLTSSWNAYNEI